MDNQLKEIIKDYWDDFIEKRNLPLVRKGGFPIIWFGEIEKYMSSSLKIVTVGINPGVEFHEESNYNKNDTKILNRANELDDVLMDMLVRNLNGYFSNNLDKNHRWFKSYNKVLQHFNAYYYNSENAVLHTDLQTALSTDPKWSDLTAEQKNIVKNTDLFDKLIKYLKPKIFISSINYIDLEKFFHDFNKIHTFYVDEIDENKGKGYITIYCNNQEQHIINGYNCKGQPYGNIKQDWADNVMAKIKSIFEGKELADLNKLYEKQDILINNAPDRISATKTLKKTNSSGVELFGLLSTYIRSLGNRATEKQRKKDYVFQGVCKVQVTKHLLVYIDLDPRTIEQSVYDEGFVKHYMNRENPDYKCISVTIKNLDHLEKAKPYIEKAYRNKYAISL